MLKSGFYTLLEKGTGLIFSLVSTMLLLRGLSKEDFAAWGLFLVIAYFFEMGRSGLLQNGLMTFVAQHPKEVPAIAGSALVLNLAFSAIASLLLLALGPWLATRFDLPQLVPMFWVYVLANLISVGLYHFNFMQQAHVEFRGIFWGTFMQKGLLFAWVVYARLTDTTLEPIQLAWIFALGCALGTAASWWYARPFLPNKWVFDTAWIHRYFQYGRYVLGTNLSTMLYKNIDKIALGDLVGPAAFAIYDAAGKVTQMVEAPSFSIAAAVFPSSARAMVEEGEQGVRTLYERSVGAILAIILPFLLLCVIFAPQLMRAFAGPTYEDSADVLRITAFFGLFMPFAVQFGTVLDSTGRPKMNFYYTLFTAVLNLILSYVLVKNYGLYAAAWAILIGYFISFLLMQHRLHQLFGIRWWRAFLFVPEAYRVAWGLVRKKIK